jgi:alpha-soluble NSF attachment protein
MPLCHRVRKGHVVGRIIITQHPTATPANILIRMGEKDEAGSAFLNAAKCYRKHHPQDAIHATQQAIDILTEKGRFQTAANNQKIIAEIYEVVIGDVERAMRAYELAADWYAGEESKAHANACLVKVATFAAQLEQWDVAIEKFEAVAAASLDNALTKWTIRDYLLKAGLCSMCTGDLIRARTALEKYQSMDVTFGETRECQFLSVRDAACACLSLLTPPLHPAIRTGHPHSRGSGGCRRLHHPRRRL